MGHQPIPHNLLTFGDSAKVPPNFVTSVAFLPAHASRTGRDRLLLGTPRGCLNLRHVSYITRVVEVVITSSVDATLLMPSNLGNNAGN